MFRTTHIRTKLALALAVPLAALVAVAGFEVVNANERGRRGPLAGRARRRLPRTRQPRRAPPERAQPRRHQPDRPRRGRRAGREGQPRGPRLHRPRRRGSSPHETASRGAVVQEAFEPAWTAFEDLESLRADVDAYDGPMDTTNVEFADSVFQRYTTIIEAFFDGTSQVALNVDDAALRNGAEIVDATTRQGEMRARIVRDIVQATITGRLDDPAVRQERRRPLRPQPRLRRHDPHQRQRPLRRRGRRDLRRGGRPELQPPDRELPRRRRRRDHPAARGGRRRPDHRLHRPARRRPPTCSPPRPTASRTRPSPGSSSSSASPSAGCCSPSSSPGSPAARSPARCARSSGRPRTWPTPASPPPSARSSTPPPARTW